jgi:hypothetical protein
MDAYFSTHHTEVVPTRTAARQFVTVVAYPPQAHRPTAAVSPQGSGCRLTTPTPPLPALAQAVTSSPLAHGCSHIVAGLSTRPCRSAAASRYAAVSIPRQGSRQAGALFFQRPGRVTCIFTFSHSSSDLAFL